MEISVKMSAEDFMEFMGWRDDKARLEGDLREVGDNLEHLADRVLNALEECGDDEYRIKSQAAIADLHTAAMSVFQ